MKSTLTPHRRRKAALVRLVTPLLALASAGLASAQNDTLTGANAGTGNNNKTQNTADGFDALQHDKTGTQNTAIGYRALQANVKGAHNTAVGYAALNANLVDDNTALGFLTLSLNTTGSQNLASGFAALNSNTNGNDNVALGYQSLFTNTSGSGNTAAGTHALSSNTNGVSNAAFGGYALSGSTTGDNNTATGYNALDANTTGSNSTAVGFRALFSDTGVNGGQNIALGADAGYYTTGQLNIMIGNHGAAAESNTIRIGDGQGATYIAGIKDASATTDGSGAAVYVGADGKLGTVASSRRFKKDIVDMGDASEALLSMRPVSFHYKSQDAAAPGREIPQFGLIAEEVAELNPGLVVHDAQGAIYSVRYEAVNAMLLNEFLKDHRRTETAAQVNAAQTKMIEEQAKTITEQARMNTEQEKQIRALGARLDQLSRQMQDVSERLGASKPAALQNAALQPEAQ